MTRTCLKDRKLPCYTRGEEIFNFVSHTVGCGIGVAVLILCIIRALNIGSAIAAVCGTVFGLSMISLYSASSIYHMLPLGTAKKVFQIIDHCTIYLLIAGTYTPMLLCALMRTNRRAAIITFAAVWGFSVLAIIMNAIDLKKYKIFSMICYIGIGWAVIFSISDMYKALGGIGFALLLLGGVLYTVGAVFYSCGKKKRYFHSVFHLFVLVGSILQSISVIFYAL